MHRRAFLGGLTAAALLSVCPGHALAGGKGKAAPKAKPRPSKLRKVEADALGVTLTFGLASAPFPCPGAPYTDDTVLVFVPTGYRVPDTRRVDLVVHFHGHRNTALAALQQMQLREQLVDSRQNALLVAPQGPLNAVDSGGGKLEKQGGLRTFLTEVRTELQTPEARKALGKSALPRSARVGTVILSAHSGGSKVAAACLQRGGYEVGEVYLFDALYGEAEAFRDWVVAGRAADAPGRHKLISFYTDQGGTLSQNRALLADLKKAGVPVLHETSEGRLTRAQLVHGTAVFIHTAEAHSGSTWRTNGLRDCLYASSLRRFQASDWFDDAKAPRAIDHRE